MSLNCNWTRVDETVSKSSGFDPFNTGMWLMILGVTEISDETLPIIRKRLKLQGLIGQVPTYKYFEERKGFWCNAGTKTDAKYLKSVYSQL